MSVVQRFRITVYDGDYAKKGALGAFLSLTGEVAFNAAGSAQFTIPADHPRLGDLSADGARVVIEYRPDPTFGWSFLLSGRVVEKDFAGAKWSPTRVFNVLDDFSALTNEVLCWPNPTGLITDQGADEAYYTKTGPAETVLKQILAPNVTRDGIRLSIPATTGLGSTITCSVRMHFITDRILPALENAGLGMRVRQSGDTRVLEVFAPTIHARALTQDSGIVTNGEGVITPPTVTRVVVGTSGEGTARTFAEDVSGVRGPASGGASVIATNLEALYKIKLPAFVDARDLDATATDYSAQLLQRIADAYSEGQAKASLSVTLVETGKFRFKVAYDVGDTFPIQLSGAPVITDKVRSVAFSASKEGGVVIAPKVGDWQDSTETTVINAVSALQRAVHDLGKR